MNKEIYDERINLDKFKDVTIYLNDYKKFPLAQRAVPNFSRPPCQFTEDFKKPPLMINTYKDNETFQYWRPNIHIPFNLLWKPRDIIDKPIEYKLSNYNKDKETSRQNRPRIYMSPAVSIDDITDINIRKRIMSYMYTSNTLKANRDFIDITGFKPKIHLNKKVNTKPDTIKFQADYFLPPIPENFKNLGQIWEHQQLKANIDSTESFWIRKAPTIRYPLDDIAKDLVSEEFKNKVKQLVKENKLRQPYDKTIPGYTGHQPLYTEGISLDKNEFDITHPILTTYQAITKYH